VSSFLLYTGMLGSLQTLTRKQLILATARKLVDDPNADIIPVHQSKEQFYCSTVGDTFTMSLDDLILKIRSFVSPQSLMVSL